MSGGVLPGVAAAQSELDRGPSRFALYQGNRIHFKSFGTGRTGVLFVHGWSCDLTIWRAQVEALSARVRLVLLDLPGHGRSAKPDITYSMDLFAGAVNAVMEAAGLDRVVLVGHSMGTPVIRQFYRTYPAKTVALVAVDGSLRAPGLDSAGVARMIEPFQGAGYRTAMERMVTSVYPDSGQEILRRAILGPALATPQHVALSAMKAMLDPSIWTDDAIDVPLLVVVAKGPNWPADYRAYVERIAPGVQYEEMDGVAHFLMMERPAAFNPILTGFLSRVGVLR